MTISRGTGSTMPTPSTSPAATKVRCATPAARAASSPRHGPTTRSSEQASGSTRSCSAHDPGEQQTEERLDPPPDLVVSTAGKEGGQWVGKDHTAHTWKAAELPGPKRDSYGAGDSFAAGLTYALGADMEPEDALRVAARCGAYKLSGRAAYENQLTAAEL
jgi:ribokinase